jgi:hypothetical protein
MHRPALVEARVEAVGGTLGEDVLGQRSAEHAVHSADRVAQRHRAERVAVIAAPDRQKPRALRPPERALVLQAHLDRHLDRHRSGVGEEHRSSPSGAISSRRSARRTRRLVREPAEHHVRHPLELLAHRLVERGWR